MGRIAGSGSATHTCQPTAINPPHGGFVPDMSPTHAADDHVAVLDRPLVSRLSVAPMMAWTDRHCRYLLRLLAPDIRLYTEMITARAVVFGDRCRLLRFNPAEHPLAVQLGGSDPGLLAEAAGACAAHGYDEINLNVGCPSGRVTEGAFGACLMKSPGLVAKCVGRMARAVEVPVTVKCRIGVDHLDDYPRLAGFIGEVAAAGCRVFIIHARKAFLGGLSPRENRTVPPLRPDYVYRLKEEFPLLYFILNGGVDTVAAVRQHFAAGVDGVMIGRKAYADPYWLTQLQEIWPGPAGLGWQRPARDQVVVAMAEYAAAELVMGARLHDITRHMLGLYHGQPGARRWRQRLGALGGAQAARACDLASLACREAAVRSPVGGRASDHPMRESQVHG